LIAAQTASRASALSNAEQQTQSPVSEAKSRYFASADHRALELSGPNLAAIIHDGYRI